jgi:hypothetical protein
LLPHTQQPYITTQKNWIFRICPPGTCTSHTNQFYIGAASSLHGQRLATSTKPL